MECLDGRASTQAYPSSRRSSETIQNACFGPCSYPCSYPCCHGHLWQLEANRERKEDEELGVSSFSHFLSQSVYFLLDIYTHIYLFFTYTTYHHLLHGMYSTLPFLYLPSVSSLPSHSFIT